MVYRALKNAFIGGLLTLISPAVSAASPVDTGGLNPDELDPGLHCLDRTANVVRRIAESPADVFDPPAIPATGHLQGDAEVSVVQDTSAGERGHREPSGLVWGLMQPMRDFQEKMAAEHAQERAERDRSWGFSSTTRIRAHVHAGGHLSLDSPQLRRLPDCQPARTE